jgi:hypothetical protein
MFSTNSNLIRSGYCGLMRKKKQTVAALYHSISSMCLTWPGEPEHLYYRIRTQKKPNARHLWDIYPTTTLCSMDFIHSFRRIWEPTPLEGWPLRGVIREPSKGCNWIDDWTFQVNLSTFPLHCCVAHSLLAMFNYYFLVSFLMFAYGFQ